MDAMAKNWWVFVVRGVASVLFGVLAIMLPGTSLTALVMLFGIYAIIDGGASLAFAVAGRDQRGQTWPYVVRGLVGVLAGFVAVAYPTIGVLTFYVLIGSWSITTGIVELAAATQVKDVFPVRELIAAGVISVAFGVLLFVLPVAGVVALIGLIAAYAIANGISAIVIGTRIHRVTLPSPA